MIAIYHKWLDTFPFNISYFTEAKEYFRTLPILDGPTAFNKYTGLATAKLQTESSLIEVLTKFTKDLLSKVDSTKLLKEGKITDTVKHQIDLINESHHIKQVELVSDFSKGEKGYLKILKTWLANEKQYFKDITPLIAQHAEARKTPEKLDNQKLHSKLQEIKAMENQFRKGIPMEVVIEHFKILTEKNSRNGKPFLTTEQLIHFLQRGFLKDKSAPKPKVNLSNTEKGFFISRFYTFYELAVTQYSDPNKKRTISALYQKTLAIDGAKIRSFTTSNRTRLRKNGEIFCLLCLTFCLLCLLSNKTL
ncbi:MAG: hypothetical protein IPP51_01790 [Bacteroidetes bacterium]|nr:hypothetical protein [Bacteroidota bacterium]